MSRKSEPPDESDAVKQRSPHPSEARAPHYRSREPGLPGDESADPARLQQLQWIRRFVHDRARALHLLAARLVGPRDASGLAHHAISQLALRVRLQALAETQALVNASDLLWRFTCKIMACRAYETLCRRRRGLDRDGDQLERAYDTLSPAERVLFILHYYYRFSESDFEDMFHLTNMQSQRLVYRARLKLKRAMREQRVKQ